MRATRNTLGDALRRAAGRNRDRDALIWLPADGPERRWSFAGLDQAADRVAAALRGIGLAPGERVVAYGRNSDAWLLAWLGCVRAALVHVPANYALTEDELAYIVQQSGARLLLSDAGLAAIADRVAARCGVARGRFAGGGGLDVLAAARADIRTDLRIGELDAAATDTDIAQIGYTSGTTAQPKGAAMPHRALLAEYASAIDALELHEGQRLLAALPLYHTAQLHCFTMPLLLAGGTSVLIEAPEPARSLALIERLRLTACFAPPTVWITWLRHADFARRDLTSLREVYYGAAIMPVPVMQELRARLPGCRPFNCYGQTEIAPLATVLKPHEHDARPASVGRPVLNVQTRIVDAAMTDVAPGAQGEIVHRSPQLMIGYWNKPEETAEAFRGDWFHSGDIGTMDEAGYITVVDRVRDVINTGGVLVASREVEDAIFTHEAVAECAVIALPDPKWIEAVTAIVVLRPEHADLADVEATLIAHARRTLAPYKLPKRVIVALSLPKNTAGKLLKRDLRRDYGGSETGAIRQLP